MAFKKRVTTQDIADACGLSRNTVSKIFNGRGAVPDATRDFVLGKAQELGYHQIADSSSPASAPQSSSSQNIALLTHSKPSLHNFGSLFITNFTDQICRSGYNLKIFEIIIEDYQHKTLPSHFTLNDISGIIMIELFDRDYTEMICGLGLPVLLVDSFAHAPQELMDCDLLYMENYASTIALTSRMIENGAKTLGFVGDRNHCNSFSERWDGFRTALERNQIPVDISLCIMADDSEPYGEVDWVRSKLDALPKIPDAFVCVNDFIAIRIMRALRQKGYTVPNDVMVSGFDGTAEAEVVEPPLSTAKIPSADIGRTAADMLLCRIANPDLPYRCTFMKTTPIWRESTRN